MLLYISLKLLLAILPVYRNLFFLVRINSGLNYRYPRQGPKNQAWHKNMRFASHEIFPGYKSQLTPKRIIT
jgi:hypothetical protein